MDSAAPNPNIFKGLGESKYEKRKGAALELERFVREMVISNNDTQIQVVIQSLIDGYVNNSNATMKAGGLMGLAAVSIALGQMHIINHLESLLVPVLGCFENNNNQVRYAACEALFNVCKVSRAHLLPHFEKLFHGAAKLATDQDQAVRNGGDVFNNLLKAIVTEAPSGTFDYNSSVTLLRHYSGTTSAFGRHFIIGWITTLDGKQDFSVLRQLPDFLFRLFEYLGDKQGSVVIAADSCLASMLKRLNENCDGLDIQAIANTVIANCGNEDRRIQSVAMNWLANVIDLAPRSVLAVLAGALKVVLTALSYDLNRDQSIFNKALAINNSLSVLITNELDDSPELIDMRAVILVLTDLLNNNNTAVQTRMETVRWVQTFFTQLKISMKAYVIDLFPVLVKTLVDSDDRVVMIALQLLVDVASRYGASQEISEPNLSALLIASVLDLLRAGSINCSRFVVIVRQWCVLSQPGLVFGGFADHIVEKYESCKGSEESNAALKQFEFSVKTVKTLNQVLFFAPEVTFLRQNLMADSSFHEDCIFSKLFQAWAHCPASALGIALLGKRYHLTSALIHSTVDLPITVEVLLELDKLVQYLESPLFSATRLHLLDPIHRMPLERSLYGILMVLPQSAAFSALHRRLSTLPPAFGSADEYAKPSEEEAKECGLLLEHFQAIQSLHVKIYQQQQIELLQSKPSKAMPVQNGTETSPSLRHSTSHHIFSTPTVYK